MTIITKVYAHILDEDRKLNAQKFETAFYANPDLRDVRPPQEETKPDVPVLRNLRKSHSVPSSANKSLSKTGFSISRRAENVRILLAGFRMIMQGVEVMLWGL